MAAKKDAQQTKSNGSAEIIVVERERFKWLHWSLHPVSYSFAEETDVRRRLDNAKHNKQISNPIPVESVQFEFIVMVLSFGVCLWLCVYYSKMWIYRRIIEIETNEFRFETIKSIQRSNVVCVCAPTYSKLSFFSSESVKWLNIAAST